MYWWRKWLRYSEWRYLIVHRIGGYFIRGRRGWASHDVWSFDTYMAGIFSGGLRELAAHNSGHPCDFPGESDGWKRWLLEKAEWFEWYCNDDDGTSDDLGWIDPALSQEEISRRIQAHIKKMDKFFNEVLPDFCKHFGALWD